jgi:predicted secreted hydrolase
MSLPLPLELTEPVLLMDDLNSQVRAQMCSGTSSYQKCKTFNVLGAVQVDVADVQIDDVVG